MYERESITRLDDGLLDDGLPYFASYFDIIYTPCQRLLVEWNGWMELDGSSIRGRDCH